MLFLDEKKRCFLEHGFIRNYPSIILVMLSNPAPSPLPAAEGSELTARPACFLHNKYLFFKLYFFLSAPNLKELNKEINKLIFELNFL